MRKPVNSAVQRKIRSKPFPAPTLGWVVNENLSVQRSATALRLENWFPTTRGARLRGGSSKWATLHASNPVLSMFTYKSGSTEKFFGATATDVYEITTVADADAVPTAAISSQTSGYYSAGAMVTTAGNYLTIVNGDDDGQLFDGTTWQAINSGSTPAITGVNTSDLSHIWIFGNREFFVEKNTLSSWYLPVDSIGGAALEFSLAGIFQKGGSLLFGATWSLDSGSGLDDKCVFVSTEGEVAIYEGTDPGSASTWSLVGVYEITEPMGPKAIMRAGGDLLIAAKDGIIPLTQAIRKDPAALSLAAVTVAIEPEWEDEVTSRSSLNWELLKWPDNNMLIVSQPITDTQEPQCLVANIETGAWCKFTGWDTRCLALFNSIGYFGTNDGKVYQMEVGGNDDGAVYTAFYAGGFDDLGVPGHEKNVKQMRVNYNAASPFIAQSSVSTDYAITQPTPPGSVSDYTVSEWDSGQWDEASWDVGVQLPSSAAAWNSIGQTGRAFAPQVQITCGVTPLPRVEIVKSDLTYETGGLVV